MLVMYMTKGSSYPLMACDTCGENIDEEHEGMAMWDWPGTLEDTPDPGECRIMFFHKGPCDDREKWPLSRELPYFFYDLLHNMKLKPRPMEYFSDELPNTPKLKRRSSGS